MELIKKSNRTFSNFLSFSRILMVFPAIYFVIKNLNDYLVYLAIIAMLTDWFDGYFARRLNQISDLGKILDPLADKILIGGTVIALYFYQGFPLWLTMFIIIRDIFILVGAIFIFDKQKKITASNWPGKIAVVCISVAVLSYIAGLKIIFNYLVIIAIVAIIISALIYVKVFMNSLEKNQ